ncbi:hypothetical protein L3Q82_017186 [Scortum barcoo]|uniref:Uncharacterized protein n=1 Tax=Scortum barcoo TaxID=214431 RepID=A0ACB8VKU5_9TELE|nr:hypothetical protein L3Q82_017186 [Scortum barcoo]
MSRTSKPAVSLAGYSTGLAPFAGSRGNHRWKCGSRRLLQPVLPCAPETVLPSAPETFLSKALNPVLSNTTEPSPVRPGSSPPAIPVNYQPELSGSPSVVPANAQSGHSGPLSPAPANTGFLRGFASVASPPRVSVSATGLMRGSISTAGLLRGPVSAASHQRGFTSATGRLKCPNGCLKGPTSATNHQWGSVSITGVLKGLVPSVPVPAVLSLLCLLATHLGSDHSQFPGLSPMNKILMIVDVGGSEFLLLSAMAYDRVRDCCKQITPYVAAPHCGCADL